MPDLRLLDGAPPITSPEEVQALLEEGLHTHIELFGVPPAYFLVNTRMLLTVIDSESSHRLSSSLKRMSGKMTWSGIHVVATESVSRVTPVGTPHQELRKARRDYAKPVG